MADAPKRKSKKSVKSAAPTADTTPSGVSSAPKPKPQRKRRRRPVKIVENGAVNILPRRRRGLTRAIKKELKREGLEGPKVSVQQKITSTFGLIGPNVTGNTELELNFFLHPSLAKEANDGTAFGPLQALAAQYSLWKIKYLTLRFTPMVGSSAVSGTVIRASLNLSQSPGGSNWSGLGTRLHLDMHPGQVSTFHLRSDQVGGPRDGGWWFTDTNEEGSQSAGPIVEVHTMGKTKSTFQSQDWDGPLFLVEGIGLWQFANYQVKPALGTLERREETVSATVETVAGQPITLDLPAASSVAAFMSSDVDAVVIPSNRASPENPPVGETIFQIVDVGAKLAENVAPPPFSWLIKGGWWFVKKILGRARNSDAASFVVYASLQDAQNNKPAIATSTQKFPAQNTTLLVTQINSPNVGPNPVVPSTRGGAQVLRPGDSFRLHSEMFSELLLDIPRESGSPTLVPVPMCVPPGILRKTDGTATTDSAPLTDASFIQTPWWIGAPGQAPHVNTSNSVNYVPSNGRGGYLSALYRLINPEFLDLPGVHEYQPPTADKSLVNFCALNSFNTNGVVTSSNPYVVYGKVLGSNLITAGTSPPISMIMSLILVTTEFRLDNDKVRDLLMIIGQNVGQASTTLVPMTAAVAPNNNWAIKERTMPVGQYLLGVSLTTSPGKVNGVDIPTTFPFGTYSRLTGDLAQVFPYHLVGQLFAPTSVDTVLRYVDYHPPDQTLIDQLMALQVPFVYPDDNDGSEIELEISDDDDLGGFSSRPPSLQWADDPTD